MFAWGNNSNKAERYAWMEFKPGYERTSGWLLIESALCHLERNGCRLMLMQKNGEVAPTLLLGHTDKHLLIDLPLDLKINSLVIRILFKDHLGMESYFNTKIFYVKDEIIHARLPDSLIRRQRRKYPRLEIPGSGETGMVLENGNRETMTVGNISAGGMLCLGRNRILGAGAALRGIELFLPPLASGKGKAVRIDIPRGGEVAWAGTDDDGRFCCGIAFAGGDRERTLLNDYLSRNIKPGAMLEKS